MRRLKYSKGLLVLVSPVLGSLLLNSRGRLFPTLLGGTVMMGVAVVVLLVVVLCRGAGTGGVGGVVSGVTVNGAPSKGL